MGGMSASAASDPEPGFPSAAASRVLFLVDASSRLEERMLLDWIERQRPAHGPGVEIMRLPASRSRRGALDPGVQAALAVGEKMADSLNEVVQMIDFMIESLVSALSWAGRLAASRRHNRMRRMRRARRARPLQALHALSLVDNHLLRDVGLDRPAVGAIGAMGATSTLSAAAVDEERTART